MTLDSLQEVFEALRRNKLRAGLTALSVAWGIFMLVILVAAGNGLRHGVEWDFRDAATNSIWIRPGKTSLPYAGQAPGRPWQLRDSDLDAMCRRAGIFGLTELEIDALAGFLKERRGRLPGLIARL